MDSRGERQESAQFQAVAGSAAWRWLRIRERYMRRQKKEESTMNTTGM